MASGDSVEAWAHSAILANRVRAFSTFGQTPKGRLIASPALTTVVTGYEGLSPLCSWIMRSRLSQAEVAAAVARTIQRFQERSLPFIWMLDPDSRPVDLARRLGNHGLTHLFDLVGMARRIDGPAPVAGPERLQVQEVQTDAALAAWVRAFTSAFDFPAGAQAPVTTLIGHSWRASAGRWRHYLGRLDGRPVASASLHLAAGAAGVYFVGTVPEARRQGIGSSMTAATLQGARERGYQRAILHAATQGVGIYQRLGFEGYCTLPLYSWQP